MHWIEMYAWRRQRDPIGRMTEVQRLMVESALARNDIKSAEKYLDDFLPGWRRTS